MILLLYLSREKSPRPRPKASICRLSDCRQGIRTHLLLYSMYLASNESMRRRQVPNGRWKVKKEGGRIADELTACSTAITKSFPAGIGFVRFGRSCNCEVGARRRRVVIIENDQDQSVPLAPRINHSLEREDWGMGDFCTHLSWCKSTVVRYPPAVLGEGRETRH